MALEYGFFKKTLDRRYKILKKLSEGNFGETYLAIDQKRPSKPLCVVKRLKPKHNNPKVLELFEQEAVILEKLGEHPQIPRLLAHFAVRNELYIIQDYVEGHNLRKEIVRGKQLSQDDVTKLLQDVLEVLVFVHQHNVIHRDIKPENVMRCKQDGKLFLIDFGSVKELGVLSSNQQRMNPTSVFIGTPGYIPTEQARGKPRLSSDIYALGMMCIEALTGIAPSLLQEDSRTGQTLWRDYVPQVSDRLADILNTMVCDEYTSRYPSAVEALQALTSTTELPLSSSPLLSSPEELLQRESSRVDEFPNLGGLPWDHPKIWSEGSLRSNFSVSSDFSGQGTASSPPISNLNLTVNSQLEPQLLEIDQSEFETAILPVQQFEFEIATVAGKSSFNSTATYEIIRSNSWAQCLIEELGNDITLEMVSIPGGQFLMGSPDDEPERFDSESPQHPVKVRPFFMGKFPVTQAQWRTVAMLPLINRHLEPDPAHVKGATRPVEQVSWDDAVEFCARLSQKTGRDYRLPSEAEWEYACRAKTTNPFHFGDTITPSLANYNHNSVSSGGFQGTNHWQTSPVGCFPPNAFGLYDMHGNVWEWCADHWHDNYQGAPLDGSAWLSNEENQSRLIRGGSWKSSARLCRSAYRSWNPQDGRGNLLGFRVAVSL
ncbi:bifunctional serine/threonine-protein kinase/formylglycine-generating enzyme family protein [Nostoc sp. UHCC 0302]|uniref:bifunctional serine/threonine-protein kinase/formylglycine-generating enzyme family protein n=1 Tax=Nostoc sp. UHCC 0302 TaxID=3134896 RepID=UPI00311C97B8